MNTIKLEKLSDCKFNALSEEEMKGIDGRGWRVEKIEIGYDSNGHQVSIGIMEYHFLGRPTGRYHAFND